jgi:hypothetical protein
MNGSDDHSPGFIDLIQFLGNNEHQIIKNKRKRNFENNKQDIVENDENKILLLFINELNNAGGFTVKNKLRNTYTNRTSVEDKINALPDVYFTKLYRLNKNIFHLLLNSISCLISPKNNKSNAISPIIKLAITLRYLAGASYLDLAFGYNLNYKTIYSYIKQVLIAIDQIIQNIHFPLDDELKLRQLEQGFFTTSHNTFPGTVAAGDGIIFRMVKPTKVKVNNDVISFFTRKGYYAYGMQGFCDSNCKFLIW